MIEATTSLTPPTSGASAATASSAAQGGFALALGAYLDATAPPAPSPSLVVPERQDDAEGGKSMPQDTGDSPDKDRDDSGAIWLPLATAPILVVVPEPAPATPIAAACEGQPGVAAPAAIAASPSAPLPIANAPRLPFRADMAAEPTTLAVDTIVGPTPVLAKPALIASPADCPADAARVATDPTLAGADGRVALPASVILPDARGAMTSLPLPDRQSWAPVHTTIALDTATATVSAASPIVSVVSAPVTPAANTVGGAPAPVAAAPAIAVAHEILTPQSHDIAGIPAAAPAATDLSSPSATRDTDPVRAPSPAPAVILAAPRGAAPAASPIQPARQAFAAALATLAIAPRRTRSLADDAASAPLTATDTHRPASPSTVHAAAETGDAPLDLGQDRGIERMIDHIEALRDDADSRDTRIRLVPDALGTVDIAVRKQGDAVHVHFAAESDATRAVLADAQPRLAQLAETRGVRIAGTSIDSGTGGGNAQPQPRPDFTRPAPAAARRGSAAEADSTTDQRLA